MTDFEPRDSQGNTRNSKKEWNFRSDPYRVRNSRPEPTTNLYGSPTMQYRRNTEGSPQHKLMEKMGWLSKDPAIRQVYHMEFF